MIDGPYKSVLEALIDAFPNIGLEISCVYYQ